MARGAVAGSGTRLDPAARGLVRAAGVCGAAVALAVLAISPAGFLVAVLVLAPVFVPGLVGVLLALTVSVRRRWRQVAAPLLMLPSLALATFMAAHRPSDATASTRTVAALVIVAGCAGAVLAVGGFASTLLARRRSRTPWPWTWTIAVTDAIVVLIALSVARPG